MGSIAQSKSHLIDAEYTFRLIPKVCDHMKAISKSSCFFSVARSLLSRHDMIWLWSTAQSLRGTFGTDAFTRLGRGTFATVYKGLHRETGNFFAIKVIKTKLDTNNKMIERETVILRELRHVCRPFLASLTLIRYVSPTSSNCTRLYMMRKKER